MARKRMVVEMGMGTDLQGQDYTKAAVRALKDALWHNSLTIAPAFGFDKEKMIIEVTIGVAQPAQVDKEQVKSVLPYGQATVEVVKGGLDILADCGTKTTVVANAAAVVYLGGCRMSLQRIILEMGTGNDLYGEDYTKAAVRAVQDALHHSSISLFRSMGIDHDTMQVEVTIGTQKPEEVDAEVIAKQIPFGTVNVNSVFGGLNVTDPIQNTVTVIASAAVAARLDIPEGKYKPA